MEKKRKNTLRGPGEVASLELQGSSLDHATVAADEVDGLGANLGHSGLSAQVEPPFLSVGGLGSTGVAAFVSRVSADTHLVRLGFDETSKSFRMKQNNHPSRHLPSL